MLRDELSQVAQEREERLKLDARLSAMEERHDSAQRLAASELATVQARITYGSLL